MDLITRLSKHFIVMMGVHATGLKSSKQLTLFFFATGMMVVFLKQVGSVELFRERLKMSVKTPAD